MLNSILLTALLGIASTIGYMTVEQGQSLSGIQSTLADHTRYFDELNPIIKDAAVMGRRLDDIDKRGDRFEAHLDATDHRVDGLEAMHRWSPPR